MSRPIHFLALDRAVVSLLAAASVRTGNARFSEFGTCGQIWKLTEHNASCRQFQQSKSRTLARQQAHVPDERTRWSFGPFAFRTQPFDYRQAKR